MEATSVALIGLIKSLPRRLFGNDPAELAKFYHWPAEWLAEIAIAEPNGIAGAIYRGDFIATSEGLKCIEINVGGVGGWIVSTLAPLYLRVPMLSRFFDEHGLTLSYRNTARLMFEHFLGEVRDDILTRDERTINVGVAVSPHDTSEFNPRSEEVCRAEFVAALRAVDPMLDGNLVFCTYADLNFVDNYIHHAGRRLHALLEQTLDDSENAIRVFRSFKAGKINLYTGPAAWIVGDKRNLALLSEMQDSGYFEERERRLIRSCIPWTRRVARTSTNYGNSRVFLPGLLLAQPERFVLKHAASNGGERVYLGRATPMAYWGEIVSAALDDGDWVVQEYVESKPYCLQSGVEGAAAHDAVWGPIVFGDRFGGGFVRVLSRAGYRPSAGKAAHDRTSARPHSMGRWSAFSMKESCNGDASVEILPIFEVAEASAASRPPGRARG